MARKQRVDNTFFHIFFARAEISFNFAEDRDGTRPFANEYAWRLPALSLHDKLTNKAKL